MPERSLLYPVRRQLERAARRWYTAHARDLPWRRTSDPYRVWLSEIMLQQTQVATVVGYYERFVTALPTVEALAAADEQQVLRLWEGLGYYRRARQLHAAARTVVQRHAGRFPREAAQLRLLPGIGRYTSGAVASIAFDAREPVLEANTVRLLARLLAERRDVASGPVQRRLWATATEILPSRDVGQFNQALMEIGSQVCTPRAPRCDECPLAAWCRTRQLGCQDQIPAPPRKTRFENVVEAAVVVWHRGRVLVRQCGEDERWAGLWDFPRFALSEGDETKWPSEIRDRVRSQTGVALGSGDSFERLTTLRHGVTRFRITLHCFRVRASSAGKLRGDSSRWLRPIELRDLPLSTTGRKIARIVGSFDAAQPGAGAGGAGGTSTS